MLAIINAELVMRDHLIPDAVLLVEDGKIAGFGEMRSTPIPEGAEIIDAEGAYVGPGLVDIHCHAGDGVRFQHGPLHSARPHMQNGTTTVLATIGGIAPVPSILESIELVREAMAQPGGANIGGIYMEGPYMNPKYGSNAHLNPWANKPIVAEDYQPILDSLGDLVKVWSIGPENEGILDFVLAAKKTVPTIRFAVGHSEATPQQIEALMPYGLCIGTHHTNATGTIVNYPECRGVCVDEGVNYNNDIYAEIISDSMGIHVDPYMQRLVRKIKGDDRIILITDQTAYKNDPIPGLEHVTDLCFTPRADGTTDVTGSKLTLNVACRNWMKHTGASIVSAFRCASYNPARAVGFTDRGEIAVGKRADLIITDHKMNVSTVIHNGKVQDIN
ncbi:MAG: amidohydrolase family protein [Oscillospiraceae bacterium]|nr:amidohydrolase family protein [Oscillospiraceae bacterium]